MAKAMTDKERAQKARDKERAKGIRTLRLKITETEASWIEKSAAQDGYEDITEHLLDLVRANLKAKPVIVGIDLAAPGGDQSVSVEFRPEVQKEMRL